MDATRHFSMLRGFHLADFLTLANAACGVAGVFCAMAYAQQRVHRVLLRGRGARAGRVHLRRVRRARGALAPHALGARTRARLARRRDLVRRRAGGARLSRPALTGGLGLGRADLLRVLRREPSRALQRHRGSARQGRQRQGRVLRRHADPDQRRAGRRARVRRLAGPARRTLYGGAWALGPWTLHPLVLLYVLSGSLMISKTLRIPKL